MSHSYENSLKPLYAIVRLTQSISLTPLQVPGGSAEFDGRIQLGDIVSHINGDSLEAGGIEQCASLLKTAQGKVGLRILRPKLKERSV